MSDTRASLFSVEIILSASEMAFAAFSGGGRVASAKAGGTPTLRELVASARRGSASACTGPLGWG